MAGIPHGAGHSFGGAMALRIMEWTLVILVIFWGLLLIGDFLEEGRLDEKTFFRANEKIWEGITHPFTPHH